MDLYCITEVFNKKLFVYRKKGKFILAKGFVLWGILRNILVNTLNLFMNQISKDFEFGLHWYISV